VEFYPEGVSADVEIPSATLPQLLDQAVEEFGRRTALHFYGRDISYAEIGEHANRFANGLIGLGVAKGDRVALHLLNSPQFIIAYFGALKAGATVTPVSPLYTAPELRHQLQDSGAQYIICQDMLHDKVARADVQLKATVVTAPADYLPLGARLLGKGKTKLPKGGPDLHRFADLVKGSSAKPPDVAIDPASDLAVLPYTGGTTAQPKGVMLTHRNMVACLTQFLAFATYWERGKEVVVAHLPFYHIYGQVVLMLGGLTTGAKMILFSTPDVEQILFAAERHGATVFFGVPTLYELLRQHPKTSLVGWKKMKVLTSGADTLHETTAREWEERTGRGITEGYGMTETSGVSHVNPLQRAKRGSFGVPIPNVLAAVAEPGAHDFVSQGDVGELLVSGPNIMRGYWHNEDETRRTLVEIEGKTWLRTGDLVRMDEEGYFFYYDRAKDLIKYKGYSVFAREIEEVLCGHPSVKTAGVVAVPEPTVGHYPRAYVVLQSEARGRVSEAELLDYLRERLAPYKVPRELEFRGELPKTDVGKVSRRELREEAEHFTKDQ
jgi:long-chain acyl-CoA synthetase